MGLIISEQDRVKERQNMFGRTGAPHFGDPHTCVPQIYEVKFAY